MDEQPKKNFTKHKKKIISGTVICILFSGIYLFLHYPPKDFPLGQVITIASGESLQSITNMLYEKQVIRSPFFFRTHVIIQGGEKKVMAGDYLLDQKIGPADLAYRLVEGQFHLPTVKATIPEGWNIFQIGDYLAKVLINFDKKQFLALAKNKEGYLFPDTYFFSPTSKPADIIQRMNDNFTIKMKDISEIAKSKYSLKEIITMASIVEDEARVTESRKIVAGILWKRFDMKMALQVDSTFLYINGKTTDELTLDDLKIDSPYNTYVYRGLPPTPVGNPGLDAIMATLNPTKTSYLYFLSDKDGVMHYSKTFEEHKLNKEKYLR